MTLTTTDIAEIVEDLAAEISPEDAAFYRPRFNVAPSDRHFIVEGADGGRVLVPARWGYLASGRPLINVRGEQVGSGSGFRQAFQSRRCAVVTDGFFEWTKDRLPVWYHRGDGGLVLLAGLYQTENAPAGERSRRFTVLTTRANQLVARVHHRMPIVLPRNQLDDWLSAPTARAVALIGPAAEDVLVATPVSKWVNSVKHDDAGCLAPAPSAPHDHDHAKSPAKQTRLFD